MNPAYALDVTDVFSPSLVFFPDLIRKLEEIGASGKKASRIGTGIGAAPVNSIIER